MISKGDGPLFEDKGTYLSVTPLVQSPLVSDYSVFNVAKTNGFVMFLAPNQCISDKGYFAVLELRQFTIEGEVNQPVAKTIVP